jgi:hypothetical protein
MHDRRKYQRYLLDQKCFLTNAGSVGSIVDICMGGLSCMCPDENKCCMDSPEKGVGIFCKTAKLLAQNLPIKVVDSTVVPGKFDNELKFRKCHMKFNQLEHSQKNHIKEIISSYALPAINESGSILPN